MPEVIEVTTYTLEELEALDTRAHEYAIEKVCARANEGGEYCQWITEYLDLRLQEEKGGTFTCDGWDYDRNEVHFCGDVDVRALLRQRKVAGKHRAFWELLKPGGLFDWSFGVESARSTHYAADFERQYGDSLDRYTDLEEDDPARYALIQRQIGAIAQEIQAYLDGIETALRAQMRAEVEWRYTPEFAQDEAEVQEFRFLANGDICDL